MVKTALLVVYSWLKWSACLPWEGIAFVWGLLVPPPPPENICDKIVVSLEPSQEVLEDIRYLKCIVATLQLQVELLEKMHGLYSDSDTG